MFPQIIKLLLCCLIGFCWRCIYDRYIPLHVFQKSIYGDVGGSHQQFATICKLEQISLRMEANVIAFVIREAVIIQMAGKSIWIPGLQVIEESKRIDIREVLIRRGDKFSGRTACKSSFNIRRKQF